MTSPAPRYRIGIDLGGTKIEAIALAPDGREILRQRVPTPKDDYRGTVAAIAGLVAKVEGELGEPATVGVGMPGAISPASGLVKNANSTWLNGSPSTAILLQRSGANVRLENDANCLAVSEATDGAAAGAPLVFGVIIGTGVGGGIAYRGEAWRGANAIAGEWGTYSAPDAARRRAAGAGLLLRPVRLCRDAAVGPGHAAGIQCDRAGCGQACKGRRRSGRGGRGSGGRGAESL